MSVRVMAACRPYWHGVQELAEGQIVPSGEFADHLLATGAPVEPLDTEPAVDLDGDGVPDGAVNAVLAWVGEDPGRAAQALDAEQAKGEAARATLVAKLSKLIEQ